MTALDLNPIETSPVSATDKVFETLYDAVISAALPPGTKVSENEIAKQLGVSRQPVRDAFFRLSNLGFLSIRPQRATFITQISLDAVEDAIFTRTALEAECLGAALATNKAPLVAALRENLDQQTAALGATTAEFHRLDEAFHEIICSHSGHAHIWSLIKDQKAHLDRIRFLTLSDDRRSLVIEEHQSILNAIQADDGATAGAQLRKHIQGVKAVAQATKTSHPTYFEAAP